MIVIVLPIAMCASEPDFLKYMAASLIFDQRIGIHGFQLQGIERIFQRQQFSSGSEASILIGIALHMDAECTAAYGRVDVLQIQVPDDTIPI